MSDHLVDLLDRQCDFLLRREGVAEFLVEVEPFLRTLEGEPQLAAHMEDLIAEAVANVNRLEAVDEALLEAAVELRGELVQIAPSIDDSDDTPPDPGTVKPSYEWSLAFFDDVAGRPAQPIRPDGSGGRVPQLVSVLRSKSALIAHALNGSSAGAEAIGDVDDQTFGDWGRRLDNLGREFEHAERTTRLCSRTSAGIAALELRLIPHAINPPYEETPADEPDIVRVNRLFRYAISADLQLLRAVEGHLDGAHREAVDRRVAVLREAVDRLREELRRRVGTTRSRLALVERFKHRAEWHDRERLEEIGGNDHLPGGPEDRLTAELARYLFDQGLSPLTKPMTGGLEPDLLDASTRPGLYVEAKQYTASGARRDITGAVKQVFDTVGRLQGTPYEVREAFCVIFRRGGPRYVLPDALEGERYRLYLRIVDIAAPAVSGRRQSRKPVIVTIADLLG